MGIFPAIIYRQCVKKLQKLGFYYIRQCRGSHELWGRDSDKATTIVPHHGNRTLSKTVIKGILKDIGLSIKEFNNL